MPITALIIGATGRVGSHLLRELDLNSGGLVVRCSSSNQKTVDAWKKEGRESVLLDLDVEEHYEAALAGVDRVFLLTGYTCDMLSQSKRLVQKAKKAGVSHIVHLGVFSSQNDRTPHYDWHDLIETYIEASGIAFTHLHPNVIADTLFVPSVAESNSFTVYWGDAPRGWVFASDIGAVAAEVLRGGPAKHGGANYFLSTEVATGPEVASIFTKVSGKTITCNVLQPEDLKAVIEHIPSVSVRAYMESAYITMKLARDRQQPTQTVVKDDVMTVLGRPGLTMEQWASQNLL